MRPASAMSHLYIVNDNLLYHSQSIHSLWRCNLVSQDVQSIPVRIICSITFQNIGQLIPATGHYFGLGGVNQNQPVMLCAQPHMIAQFSVRCLSYKGN